MVSQNPWHDTFIALMQVRVPIDEVAEVLRQLTDMQSSWQEVSGKYPAQQSADADS